MTCLKPKKTLSLRNLLIISIFLYMLAILIGSFSLFFGSNPLFDETTVILSLGLGLLLLFAVKVSRRYLFDQIAVITFFFLIYILPRVLAYLFAPSVVSFPFGDDINATTINIGLLYIFIGTMFLVLGMKIADKIFQPHLPQSSAASGDPSRFSAGVLFTLFLIALAFELYVSLIMGISPYAKMRAEAHNTIFQFIRVSFGLNSTFIIVVATLLFRRKMVNKNEKIALLVVTCCYILFTVSMGSRSGIVRVLMISMIALVVIWGNPRFKMAKTSIIIFLLVGLGFVSFQFATTGRIFTRSSYLSGDSGAAYKYAVESKTKGSIVSGLNRLGEVDYPILFVTQEGDAEAKQKYINFLYSAKNIVNALLPGTVFQEAEISTSRVIDVIYRGGEVQGMYSHYFSEPWTLWGLAYVYFGWLGGLLWILFVGFVIHSLYALIVILSSGLYQFYLRLWLLYFVTMMTLNSMGFDSHFVTIFINLLQFTIFYFSLFLLQNFYGLLGGFFKQTVKPKARAHRLPIPDDKLCEVRYVKLLFDLKTLKAGDQCFL